MYIFRKIGPMHLLSCLVLAISVPQIGHTYAQPGAGEAWSPPESPFGVTGPMGPGTGFYMYFEDRSGNRRTQVYADEFPVYLIISTAPGTIANIGWAVQYWPPNHQIHNWLFQRQVLGGAGTYRLGPYATISPGDPTGPYVFRVGILSKDAKADVHWNDQVIHLTYSGDRPPTIAMPPTVLTTLTTSVPAVPFFEFGIPIFIGLVIVAAAILVTRRKPLSERNRMQPQRGPIAAETPPPQAPSTAPRYDLTESLPEEKLLAAITTIRLPQPRAQHSILDREGRPFTMADFAYPDRRIAIYIDAYDPRFDPQRWENNLEQTNKLILLGWKPLRFSARKALSSTQECVIEIEQALRAP